MREDPTPDPLEADILLRKMLRTVNDMQFPVRLENRLKWENMNYVGDIIQKNRGYFKQIPGLGKTSLDFLEKRLEELGLSLGTRVCPGVLEAFRHESKRTREGVSGWLYNDEKCLLANYRELFPEQQAKMRKLAFVLRQRQKDKE